MHDERQLLDQYLFVNLSYLAIQSRLAYALRCREMPATIRCDTNAVELYKAIVSFISCILIEVDIHVREVDGRCVRTSKNRSHYDTMIPGKLSVIIII